jgi:hypothetical protein
MTYEEKERLFNKNRYLMPLPPLGTKNWTVTDFIRYIDQSGRWCPEGNDSCELYDESTINNSQTTTNRLWADGSG